MTKRTNMTDLIVQVEYCPTPDGGKYRMSRVIQILLAQYEKMTPKKDNPDETINSEGETK
jgi:hypothetical protein